MAQPPADDSKNGPSLRELAAGLSALHEELHTVRDRLYEQLKALEGRIGEVVEAAGAARNAAATAEKAATAAAAAAAAAEKAAGDAVAKAAAAETKAAEADAKAVAADNKAVAAETKATTAEQRAGEASAAVAAITADVAKATGEVKELREAFGDDPAALPPRAVKLAPFLTVPVRDVTFDPIAEKAIAAVLAARQADVDKLARDIVAGGIASAIGRVSERLGRARITEARRHILAVAYPDLLRSRLGDPVKGDLAKDPPGLADSLLADLDAKGGPLDTFADKVVEASEESMSLNLKDHERASLRQRVRDSL